MKLKPRNDSAPPAVDAKSWHPIVEQRAIVIHKLKPNKTPDVGGWTTESAKTVFLQTAWRLLRRIVPSLFLHVLRGRAVETSAEFCDDVQETIHNILGQWTDQGRARRDNKE